MTAQHQRIVKVCGMRDADNIRQVEALGIQWMGFIFCPQSSRHCAALPAYLPQHCRRIGVFVDATLNDIMDRQQAFRLDGIQLHGHETPKFCRQLRSASAAAIIIKMIPVATADDMQQTADYAPYVDYFLFETKLPAPTNGINGGSGVQFDWDILAHYHGTTPFLLTGGITPDDAPRLRAIRHPQFAGIDLNSKFESSPGIKDVALLRHFLHHLHEH